MFNDIKPFCADCKPCGCITENIAVLLSANGDMVYDLQMTVLPGHGAMKRLWS